MKKVSNVKSISDQLKNVKSQYSHFKSRIRRNTLVVKGQLQPTARSLAYDFILEYKVRKRPNVRIIAPILVRNNKGEKIPHMYGQKYLCLYQPRYKEFKSSDFLSDTIIPWISLWLYYYEQWHIVGKWLGGGEHPVPKKKKNAKKR